MVRDVGAGRCCFSFRCHVHLRRLRVIVTIAHGVVIVIATDAHVSAWSPYVIVLGLAPALLPPWMMHAVA